MLYRGSNEADCPACADPGDGVAGVWERGGCGEGVDGRVVVFPEEGAVVCHGAEHAVLSHPSQIAVKEGEGRRRRGTRRGTLNP